jgi:hypothetical protein
MVGHKTASYRRRIPLGVRLHAVLLLLGYTDEEIRDGLIEWDHCPALGLRFANPVTGELEPAPNDPRFIRPLRKREHRQKTLGSALPLSGDISLIAKQKRIEKEVAAFRARMLAKTPGVKRPRRSKLASRPFAKRCK